MSRGSGRFGETTHQHDTCILADAYYRSTAQATRPARSRSVNTAHGYADRFNPVEEEPEPEAPRMVIPKLSSRNRSPTEASSPGGYALRPSYSRTSTYDGSTNGRDDSPARRLTRVPTDSSVISSRNNLRPVRQANAFADEYEDDYASSNGHRRDPRDRSPPSPDRSSVGSGSVMSRAASWSAADSLGSNGKKAPPPPPPSRAKKPPPPPPPMKRSALSASELARY
jgi:hypothetical protein